MTICIWILYYTISSTLRMLDLKITPEKSIVKGFSDSWTEKRIWSIRSMLLDVFSPLLSVSLGNGESFHERNISIVICNGNVTCHIQKRFYFYNPPDTLLYCYVSVTGWFLWYAMKHSFSTWSHYFAQEGKPVDSSLFFNF